MFDSSFFKKFVDVLGYKKVIMKNDNEPSVMVLRMEVKTDVKFK